MTKAIIIDDEANLVDHMVRLLNQEWPELSIVGTANSGKQALTLIERTSPDIVFTDIEMPDINGLQVASQLHNSIHIVFVTAFNRYAVEAFERSAVDYILKPVTAERLKKTINRLQSMMLSPTNVADQNLLTDLINNLSKEKSGNWLQWLRTGSDTKTELVSVEDAIYFKADNKYTTLYTKDKEFLIRCSINSLSESLNPEQFWRVHRGIVVKIAEIQEANRDIRGRYNLTLKNRAERLRTSQSYGHLFKLAR